MKRSGSSRFALEAAFLIVVAAGSVLTGPSPLRILLLMLGAWLLVALTERARKQAWVTGGSAFAEVVVHEARAGFFGRWRRKAAEPLAAPAEPPEDMKTVVEEAAAPAVTKRPLELPGLEVTEPEPEPEPFVAPPPVDEAPPEPRKWNVWDLERGARERAGETAPDEERTALFVYLREFANTQGVLPVEFDGLVRESFADLIQDA